MGVLLPSYAQGFARNAAETAHPRLWDKLVRAYAPALGRTGSQLLDVGGRNAHGTFQNLSADGWGMSPIGPALSFNGSTEYVSCPTLVGVNHFTVAAYVGSVANGTRSIVGQVDVNFENCTFYLRRGSASGFTTGGATYHETSGFGVTDGAWQSVVLRYDGTTLSAHLDGVETSSAPETGTPDVPAGSTSLSVGRSGLFGGQYWNGEVAYVCVWNRALAPDEIVSLAVDPFAMFRILSIARRHVAAPAAGNAMPMAMGHYRRRRAG